MRTYTVVSAFMGECCMSPHFEIDKVEAASAKQAERQIFDKLKANGLDVGDCKAYTKL